MWTTQQMPDLTGKTVLVTGANAGIGYETALAFYQAGAHVVLACRNLDSARRAQAPLLNATPGAWVVTVTSMGYLDGRLDFANLRLEKRYDGLREYRQSKLANLLALDAGRAQ